MVPRTQLRITLLVAAVSVALPLAASCAPDPQGGAGDAPIVAVEREGWTILNNVDGFPNIAFRCRGTNGIYVTRSADDTSDTMQVITDDPACSAVGSGSASSSTTTTTERTTGTAAR